MIILDGKRLQDCIDTKSKTPLPSWQEMDNFISRYIDWDAKPANKFTLISAWRYAVHNSRMSNELSKKVAWRVTKITGFLEKKYPYYIAAIRALLEEKADRAEWKKIQSEDRDWLS